jgi:hypothetical protein
LLRRVRGRWVLLGGRIVGEGGVEAPCWWGGWEVGWEDEELLLAWRGGFDFGLVAEMLTVGGV